MKSTKGFTLVEILIVCAILGMVGLFIAKIYTGGIHEFSDESWKQVSQRQLERALQTLDKYFKLAAYPTLNSFQGVITHKDPQWSINIHNANLEEGNAFSEATRKLVRGKAGGGSLTFEGQVAKYWFYGSGMQTDLGEDDTEIDILSWTSCRPGYDKIPGFPDEMPRCGKHRLFLKGRKKVMRANPSSYQYFQTLYLENRFCVTKTLRADPPKTGYMIGKGIYEATDNDFVDTISGAPLQSDEKAVVGTEFLAANVATVTVKIYQNPNDRATTMDVDIVTVAPHVGNSVIKKSVSANVTVGLIEGTGVFTGTGTVAAGELTY